MSAARGGTWAVVLGAVLLVLAAVVVAVAGAGAHAPTRFAAESAALRDGSDVPAPLDPAALAALPEPARRFARAVLGPGAAVPRVVRLRHDGRFRTDLDGPWLDVRGEQLFRVEPPAFLWWGRVSMAPGVWFDAWDRSVDGRGEMRVELDSVWPLVDARGPELDQGALLRLLGESVWFPAALFDARRVTWSALDARRARLALRVGALEVTAVATFGDDGRLARLEARRYRAGRDGAATLAPWVVDVEDYRVVSGQWVPFRCVVSWIEDGTVKPYADWRVRSLVYDEAPDATTLPGASSPAARSADDGGAGGRGDPGGAGAGAAGAL